LHVCEQVPLKNIRRRSSTLCSLALGWAAHCSPRSVWPRAQGTAGFFAGTLTVALYIVTDMEYPRLGLIRIENFDHFLADVYDQMR